MYYDCDLYEHEACFVNYLGDKGKLLPTYDVNVVHNKRTTNIDNVTRTLETIQRDELYLVLTILK